MAIIKWEPFREFDRFFDEEFLSFPQLFRAGWDLAVDVYEEKNYVVAEMTLPGIDPEKVEVMVEDDYLKVRGSREEEKEEKKKNYYSKEIKRGSFERMVKLPTSVKGEKAVAEYKNGVLKIVVPKKEETKTRRIKVSVKK
jgi:HSP20 family protein